MGTETYRRTRRMILGRVLTAPFIVMLLVCGSLVYHFATSLRHQVTTKLVRIVEGHRRIIEQSLDERIQDLQFVAASSRYEDLTRQGEIDLVLKRLQATSQAFLDLGVFDESGIHFAYAGPYTGLVGKKYAETHWFQEVQDKSVYVSDVFLGFRNIPHFVIVVRQEEGDHVWFLRATIDSLFFNELVGTVRVGKTGEAYLVNRDGIFETPRRSGGALMEADPEYPTYRADDQEILSFSATDRSGERYVYATGRLRQTGWLLVVRQEADEAYGPLTRAVWIAVGLIIVGGGIVVFTAFVLASGLANRLRIADLEKQEMGTQLIMAGRLAEVGEMSAGVAHEINNPLQVMKSEYTLIQEILKDAKRAGGSPSEEDLRQILESLEAINQQIDRCKDITQGLLKFARKTEPSIQPIDLSAFLHSVVAMVEHGALLENIRIVEKSQSDLEPIESDPAQLQQVFLNLLNNAIHALKGRENAEIRITVGKEDGYATVAVADNGCGIPPENLEKIFLPFFTTKPVGQGTGLGLSTCYGIVEKLGGRIAVSSELHVGSVFTVYLPLAGPPEEARRQAALPQTKGGTR